MSFTELPVLAAHGAMVLSLLGGQPLENTVNMKLMPALSTN